MPGSLACPALIKIQKYILTSKNKSVYNEYTQYYREALRKVFLTREKENHMDIILNNASGVPIYEQIEEQIKGLMMTGELKAGDALPSMRLLAKELKISVITTKRAYEDLERDGYIETIVGKGSFAKAMNSELMKETMLFATQELMEKAVDKALMGKVSLEEMLEMLEIIYEEKKSN